MAGKTVPYTVSMKSAALLLCGAFLFPVSCGAGEKHESEVARQQCPAFHTSPDAWETRRLPQLDALYWAHRIAAAKETGWDEFKAYSADWNMAEMQKRKILDMAAADIQKGRIREFNASQKNFFEARRRSRWLPGPGRLDQGLIRDMGREEAVEIIARYWIWRIGILSELSIQDLEQCNLPYKKEFLAELNSQLLSMQKSGAAHALSNGELHKLDAAMEKASRLGW